jgi:hypothetical protein
MRSPACAMAVLTSIVLRLERAVKRLDNRIDLFARRLTRLEEKVEGGP